MLLVAIPSENCPECRKKGGTCQIVIEEISTVRTFSVKTEETQFRAEYFGERVPNHRTAYTFHKYLCSKGKGFQT